LIKIKRFRRINYIALLFGVLLFVLSQPYFVWNNTTILKLASILLVIISLFYIKSIKITEIFIISLFIIYILIITISNSFTIIGTTSYLFVIIILLIKNEKVLLFLKYFKSIIAISLFLSLISYFLIITFNISLPYNRIESLNILKAANYIQYPFLVSEYFLGFRYFNLRFCGMFDEPGVVGSMAVLFLLIDKFSFKSFENKIILLAGILSFSFYFYASMAVYLFYIINYKSKVYFVLSFLLFYSLTINNDVIYTLVWERFDIVDGRFFGDNRSGKMLDDKFDTFVSSGNLWGGIGFEEAKNYSKGSSTFKTMFMGYGLLFSILVCSAFLVFSWYHIKNTKFLLAYWFLFFGMLYQRYGFIYDLPHFYLFIATVYSLSQWDRKKYKESVIH
jgi:hypothetical protein